MQRYTICWNYTKKPDCIMDDSREIVYDKDESLLSDFGFDGDDVHE